MGDLCVIEDSGLLNSAAMEPPLSNIWLVMKSSAWCAHYLQIPGSAGNENIRRHLVILDTNPWVYANLLVQEMS